MVQRQFGEDVELLPPRKFRFADRGQQARIEIQFQRNIPDSGWILALESNNKVNILVCVKVCMCSVNFFSLLCTRLESGQHHNITPPYTHNTTVSPEPAILQH